MGEKKRITITVTTFIWILVIAIIITAVGVSYFMLNYVVSNNKDVQNEVASLNTTVEDTKVVEDVEEVTPVEVDESTFDYAFLKLENQEKNKIYSPLSIKYALKMLEEGANGDTKKQIENVLGNFTVKKYTSNNNFSFANGFFIRDTFKDNVKADYINNLKDRYDAEVKFDDFANASNINSWVKDKTLNIIPKIAQDEVVTSLDFVLVNALAIDMEWDEKFLCIANDRGYNPVSYYHEKIDIIDHEFSFFDEYLDVYGHEEVSEQIFHGVDGILDVSGIEINATINNYDIVSDLGEENIKKIVAEQYKKYIKGEEYDEAHVSPGFPLSEDTTDAGIQRDLDAYLPTYIDELKSNYHNLGATTSFSIYTDDDVKVFAKDLKEYEGTTLEYIGIMPKTEDLDKFIETIDNKKINNYISNLKNVDDYNDFKDGVVTKINGFIPKFDFEYDLDLLKDLKALGVTNVFDETNSDLSNMIEGPAFIAEAIHKADIEFTQDGIKAAAVSVAGGAGAGSPFDYFFDVPYEIIDMNFDGAFMFIIRDKESGEIWFTGTVYEPLLYDDDTTNDYYYNN